MLLIIFFRLLIIFTTIGIVFWIMDLGENLSIRRRNFNTKLRFSEQKGEFLRFELSHNAFRGKPQK